VKVLRTGDVFWGKSYVDMINRAIGTNLKEGFRASGVSLDEFGLEGVIAWFVFMDGTVHGYADGWEWVNKISIDGKEIDEYNISTNKTTLKGRRAKEGYHPYRLAFQLDPYGEKDNHRCRFVGAFRFDSFIRKDSSAVTYIKIGDQFYLAGKGERGAILGSKADFIPLQGKYITPIEEMGFSNESYGLLKPFFSNAGDLLEVCMESECPLVLEIQNRLFECFKNTKYI
jgi:hypothetical protein